MPDARIEPFGISDVNLERLRRALDQPSSLRNLTGRPIVPRAEYAECVEWEEATRTMRFHFAKHPAAWGMKTLCGTVVKEKMTRWDEAEEKEHSTGFMFNSRWDHVEDHKYAIVYCSQCGVEPAGVIHDRTVSRIRSQQREDNARQRETQEREADAEQPEDVRNDWLVEERQPPLGGVFDDDDREER